MSLTTADEASWSYMLAMFSQLTADASSAATQDRIAKLKAQLESIKAQLKPLIDQLQFLLSHPLLGAPKPTQDSWSAAVERLRRMIARLEVAVKAILSELASLRA
jgi:hypothetical protein